MSETNTVTKTIIRQVAGQDRVFTLPNSYDKMELIEEYQRQRKAKLLETLNMADASPDQKVIELNTFDGDPPLDYVTFLKTPRGRLFGFTLSLRHKYGDEAEAITKQIDFGETEEMDLTIQLFSLIRTQAEAQTARSTQNTSTYGDSAAPPANPNMQTYASIPADSANPISPTTQANQQ